jgi:hypothetical protein
MIQYRVPNRSKYAEDALTMVNPRLVALPILVTKLAPVPDGVSPETAKDFLVRYLRQHITSRHNLPKFE